MLVYQTDYTGDGRFVGVIEADPDPMEEGQFLIPAGAVEIAPPEAQEPAYARWTGDAWEVFTPPAPEPEPEIEPGPNPFANFIPVPLLRQRIEALGMWEAFAAYLAQNPAEMLKVLTVETGVDPAYPALTVAFEAMDVPQAARDAILAPPSAGVNVP